MITRAVTFICSFLCVYCCAALEFTSADVVIPDTASPYLKFCASELASHLNQITGGKFAITSGPTAEVKIFLGQAPKNVTPQEIKALEGDGFYTVVQDKEVYIVGKDSMASADPYRLCYMLCDRGTLAGVYCFLEEQGVRFLAPGDDNTFVPKKTKISVVAGKRLSQPIFIERVPVQMNNFTKVFSDAKEYQKKPHDVNMWALRNRYNTNKTVRSCHTEQFLQLGEYWRNEPEHFMQDKTGKRNARYSCWTDPAVKELWFRVADAYFSGKSPAEIGMKHLSSWRSQYLVDEFMIDPMDHGSQSDGRCRCERCEKFRQTIPCEDDSEIMWAVLADVANRISQKHPGKYISTLVYPPKRFMPKKVKIPANIRVRVCLDGPKMVNEVQKLQADVATLKQWRDLLGKANVKVWLYQCEIFGGKLPGPMEIYPDKFARYIRAIEPYCAGIFYEFHGLTFTYKHLEMYLQGRLMWDPSQDVDALKHEFIQLYYGPAAEPMAKLYTLMETQWDVYWRNSARLSSTGASLGRALYGQALRKIAWQKAYTTAVMTQIDGLLKDAAVAAKGRAAVGTYAARVALWRKYVFDIMRAERAKVMDLSDLAPVVELSSQWCEGKLVNADISKKGLNAATTFKMRRNNGRLEFEVTAFESGKPKVKANRGDGSPDIWQDSCVELFFYTAGNETLKHLLVNWHGRATLLEVSPKSSVCRKADEFDVQVVAGDGNVVFKITMPETALAGGDFRFNLTRERITHGERPEYSTFSLASTLGLWDNPDSFAKIKLK